MFKYYILFVIVVVYSYNIICKYEYNNFIKKSIYIKDNIYFNNNIKNITNINEWIELLDNLNIYYNNTLNDLINGNCNVKTIILVNDIYNNINKIKYNSKKQHCEQRKIYWTYYTYYGIDNNILIDACNKSFNAWNKYINDCNKFIFTNNKRSVYLKISIIKNNEISNHGFDKNVLAHYHTNNIHLNYDYIIKNINNKKFLIVLIMHEIGHFLGLNDNNNIYSVMNSWHNYNIYDSFNISDPSKILHYFDINKILCC
ncbi:unknown similar to AMEV070 [Choristoneura biennis entomopoxvirus]|uniref:Peptidase M10 metallopeptidase domain-containing protein n=1 Tax=Choristoneura biennis entomopoxvirus TaxID=10288 RepID=A0A916P197_CBEPV|nr:unknown similar to AMEV070 [Choristoneura biennis entomopoxvirus]CCU55694.1 unknown similar to AMEV070 [Choristoneura biennis entomopoxvirus]